MPINEGVIINRSKNQAAIRSGRARRAGALVSGINPGPTPKAGQVDLGRLGKAGEIPPWLGQP